MGAIEPLALTRQCFLAGVNRSTVYAPHRAAEPDEEELTLLTLLMLIDAEYTRHPFYGSRKIKVYLRGLGYKINRAAWVRVLGGSDRRVLAQSVVVAVVKHAGSWVLCGLFGAGIADLWHA